MINLLWWLKMNKNVRKIMAWVLLILMVGSIVASLIGYIIASK